MASRWVILGVSSLACLLFAGGWSVDAESVPGKTLSPSLGVWNVDTRQWPSPELPMMTTQGVGELPALDEEGKDAYANMAKSFDVPTEVLIDEFWTGDEFNQFVDELAEDQKGGFVAAGRVNPAESASAYYLVLTAPPSNVVLDRLIELPVNVDIYYGAPASRSDLRQAQRALYANVASALPEGSLVEVTVSPMGTALMVSYKDPDESPHSKPSVLAAVDRTQEEGGSQSALLPVRVEFDPNLASVASYVNMKGGFGYSGCTSGFAASNNGNSGLLTAKHCADHPYYSSTGVRMGNLIEASSWIDIQWNRAPSPHVAVPKFRVNSSGTKYTVSAVSNPVYGDPVEKYGMTTGRTSGWVTDADWCADSRTCRLFVANFGADHGDSGAPCFSAGTARGILSGGNGRVAWCTQIGAAPVKVMKGGS